MMGLRLSDLAQMVNGRLVGADNVFDGVSSDTRDLRRGQLFVALKGPSFDGHDYLHIARQCGAAGFLVAEGHTGELPRVEVTDTLFGLTDLARQWRQRSHALVIGLTGSNGKTTLKEMLAAILRRRGSVLATQGNLNNHIGVPLTLCRLRDERFAVIEMGASGGGEIAHLTDVTRPQIAILNNAGRAHLEGFGSLEGVARGKAEIMRGLGDGGIFVYNADDTFAGLWQAEAARLGLQRCGFGILSRADVYSPLAASRLEWCADGFESVFPVQTAQGTAEIRLRLAGDHNRMNALAATAAALAAGLDLDAVVEGLGGVAPVPGRLCPIRARHGARVIDDSYNANPDSVLAALQVLATAPGRLTLVLGDLAELGEQTLLLHRQLGIEAARLGIHRLWTCGSVSASAGADFAGEHRHFTDALQLGEALQDQLSDADSILVKGSRAARMERVVSCLSEPEAPC